jgi:hypothetical protein
MKFCLMLAATALLGAFSLEARAQAWLPDRAYGEGEGLRVGNLELHMGAEGQLGYDSNYFLRSSSEGPLSVYVIRVTPSISVATLGPQRREAGGASAPTDITFRGGAYVSENQLIAADSKQSTAVHNQSNWDGGADFALNVFPAGRAGIDIYADGIRAIQPSNDVNTENAFNRDSFRAGAGLTWRPGGGLFDWRAGYEFSYNYFEKSAYNDLNNYQDALNMRGRWRFLPRTALLYDGSYTWIRYPNTGSNSPDGTQNDGAILQSQIGINGLVLTRLSVLALVGWTGTFYDTKGTETPQQFDSLTGQLELKWFISGGQESLNAGSVPVGLSYASLGYTRGVSNSYLGNFYQSDRVYASISYLLGGVFDATLSGGIANLSFPTSFFADGVVQQPAFSEQRADATLNTEYRLSNVVGLNASVTYLQNITNVKVPIDEMSKADSDALAFSRWQVFLGARCFL